MTHWAVLAGAGCLAPHGKQDSTANGTFVYRSV